MDCGSSTALEVGVGWTLCICGVNNKSSHQIVRLYIKLFLCVYLFSYCKLQHVDSIVL